MAAKKSMTKKKAATKKALPKESSKPPIDAAESGNLKKVQAYLDAGGNIDAQGLGGWTLLSAAVRSGHVKLAESLLEAGADPNIPVRKAIHLILRGAFSPATEMFIGCPSV